MDVLSFFLSKGLSAGMINQFVDVLTNGTGLVPIPLPNATVTLPLGSLGSITLGAKDIAVAGLDTWENDTSLLTPHDSYNLMTTTDLGRFDLNVSWFVSVNTTAQRETLVEDATLTLALSKASLVADTFMAIDSDKLDALATPSLFNLDCLLSTTTDVNMTALVLNFTTDDLAIRADAGTTAADIDSLLNNLLAVLYTSYSPAVPALLDSLLMETVRPGINDMISHAIANATCPPVQHTAGTNASALAGYLASAGATVLFVLIGLVLAVYARRIKKQRRKNNLTSSMPGSAAAAAATSPYGTTTTTTTTTTSSSSGGGVPPSSSSSRRSSRWSVGEQASGGKSGRHMRQSSKDSFYAYTRDEDETEETTALLASRLDRTSSAAPCLALEPTVSAAARYIVPLMLLATVALFIWSNNSVGADVFPAITLGDDHIEFEPLFSFDLTNSVRDMWNAGVYPLSLLIGLFSGSWPYLKLMLMLAAWLLPISWLSVSRRETLLQVLDALGKWSLIDSFVMIMMLVAFRFHLPFRGPDDDPTVASFDIFVEPGQGLHSFILATVLSLVMSHVILHIHRTAADYHRRGGEHTSPEEESPERQLLAKHVFTSKASERYSFTVFGSVLLMGMVLSSIALLIYGALIDAFTFEFKGLAALAMAADGIDPNRNFSLITIGQAVPPSVPNPDSFFIRYIQALLYILALVVPLLQLVSLVVIWCTPLTLKAQKHLFHVCEVLNAWAGLDVFVVSLIAAVMEIQQFAQFVIGDKCDPINALLVPVKDEWPLLRDDARCFDVVTVLQDGSWALFGSVVASTITVWTVMPLCHRAINDRLGVSQTHPADRKMHNINSLSAFDESYEEAKQQEQQGQRCKWGVALLSWLRIIRYDGVAA